MSQKPSANIDRGTRGLGGGVRLREERIACHENPQAKTGGICPICRDPKCGYGTDIYR